MAGQTYGSRAMLTECSGIGQCVQINGLKNSIFIRTQTHMYFHLVTRGRSDLGFIAGVDQLGRFSCLPGYQRRVNLRNHRLLCTKSAADPRLEHTDLRLRDIQRVSYDTAHMERDLRGGCHV